MIGVQGARLLPRGKRASWSANQLPQRATRLQQQTYINNLLVS
ncbi:hypothetical protein QUF49_15815 [Fictibacillus sp. b24]|nr:hypothetical protein [Fictibacillus sp. b24]MDM5317478.1 hypothetical protein [Fictibacillus sp. b24]